MYIWYMYVFRYLEERDICSHALCILLNLDLIVLKVCGYSRGKLTMCKRLKRRRLDFCWSDPNPEPTVSFFFSWLKCFKVKGNMEDHWNPIFCIYRGQLHDEVHTARSSVAPPKSLLVQQHSPHWAGYITAFAIIAIVENAWNRFLERLYIYIYMCVCFL